MPSAVLLADAGASDNITLLLDVDKLTSVALGLPLSNKVRRGAVTVLICEVSPIDEGLEVEESRGGLGSLEMVLHVLLLLVFGLDPESEGVLLTIELS